MGATFGELLPKESLGATTQGKDGPPWSTWAGPRVVRTQQAQKASGEWQGAGVTARTQRTTPTPGNEGTVAPSQDNEKPDAVGGDGENRSAEPKGQPATVEDVMQRIRALDALPTVVVRDLGGIGAQIPTTGPSTSSTGPGPK